ncbi:MAG: TIGR00341 family protein [bacterium]
MKMKIVEVVSTPEDIEVVAGYAHREGLSHWSKIGTHSDKLQTIKVLVPDHKQQALEDTLQNLLAASENAVALVQNIDTVLPRRDEQPEKEQSATVTGNLTRAELYHQVEGAAQLDNNYLLLTILSTIVAAIGLVESNIAVIIGAMVIAPLLGPNIALAMGTTLGDTALIKRAAKTGAAGMGIALTIGVVIGLVWQLDQTNTELMSRTEVGFDDVALALASGAAGVLSLLTGLPSVLVGVMVAVALLPPLVTAGIMLGAGESSLATGAALLLLVNIVSVNLAAKFVFIAKGIEPSSWYEQQAARKHRTLRVGIWMVTLLLLMALIGYRLWIN